MERRVGGVFEYNGVPLIAIKNNSCNGCFFNNADDFCTREDRLLLCSPMFRKDNKSVIFKKMEERTIKLTLEKAKEFYKKGGEFRDLALSAFTEEELTKMELPKTWEEFCANYKVQKGECFINSNSVIEYPSIEYTSPSDTLRLVCTNSNLLPNKKAAEAHLALIKLHQLRDCYRQGWKPDWSDNKNKYCIIHNGVHIINTCTKVFLSFQSRKLAEEFLNNFRDLIEEAGDLI